MNEKAIESTILIGLAGGALFLWAQLPGGLITGAMVAVGVAGMAGRKVGLPPPLSHIVLMVLGMQMSGLIHIPYLDRTYQVG